MFSKNTSTTYKYFFMFVFFSLFLWQSFTIKPEASEIITDPLISMTVGDTKNLYFFHGDSASAYFSSNPNIASVTTGGVLNANDVGSAEIIYSVHGVFHQREINVADIENPSFSTTQRENLILPDNALTTTDPVLFMQKKDSYTIQFSSSSQALATRYKGLLIWKSDKPNIVRVDSNGKVTALKKGSATITCTLGNVSCHTYVNVITDSYTGKATDFSMLTATGKQRTYRLFKQNAHNYPRYDSYLAWHGCATCSLATVLGAYNDNYSGILPSSVIDGVEKQFTSNKDWTREHVNRSLRGQMPLSLYGISSILKSSGVDNNYVRTYTDSEAKHDIISHLKTGNSIIFEVRQKNSRTGKRTKRWTNSYHTMVLLGVLTNGKVLLCDSVDRSWYNGGQRLKIVDLSDIMEYMFPCTSFSESMYYNGASSDGGYIKIYEIS